MANRTWAMLTYEEGRARLALFVSREDSVAGQVQATIDADVPARVVEAMEAALGEHADALGEALDDAVADHRGAARRTPVGTGSVGVRGQTRRQVKGEDDDR